jgi:hypothetical protein
MTRRVSVVFVLVAAMVCANCIRAAEADNVRVAPVSITIRGTGFAIPKEKEIASIYVESYGGLAGFKPVDRFEVPIEKWGKILGFFTLNKVHEFPTVPAFEVGLIQIKTRGGRKHSIPFYWAGNRPLLFSLNGVRMQAIVDDNEDDGALRLDATIRNMRQELTGEKDLFELR